MNNGRIVKNCPKCSGVCTFVRKRLWGMAVLFWGSSLEDPGLFALFEKNRLNEAVYLCGDSSFWYASFSHSSGWWGSSIRDDSRLCSPVDVSIQYRTSVSWITSSGAGNNRRFAVPESVLFRCMSVSHPTKTAEKCTKQSSKVFSLCQSVFTEMSFYAAYQFCVCTPFAHRMKGHCPVGLDFSWV